MLEYKVDAVCFDDILLVPQRSSVPSRHSVNTEMCIGRGDRMIKLDFPIIAAPMDTVCGREMCEAMAAAGGLGILHRYMPYDKQLWQAKTLVQKDILFGVAIASNNGFIRHAKDLVDAGVKLLLVDTANGHGSYAIDAVRELRAKFPHVHIMAGNVATSDGFARLAAAGADSIRVGIGGGSACTTRLVSGHGIPTLASIMDCDNWKERYADHGINECSIIADGGIRNSGDIVKAFAAGADAVMVGSLLAGTDESPGNVYTDGNGNSVKSFRGMASAEAQQQSIGSVSVAEGVSTTVPYKGSVNQILDKVRGGIGSGCSYTGVHNVFELSNFAKYVKVSSSSLNESQPHAL